MTQTHDQCACEVRMKTDAAIITRLQGEARVMLDLLSEAVAVLDTIEPECAPESESLDRLKYEIRAVIGTVAKRGGV